MINFLGFAYQGKDDLFTHFAVKILESPWNGGVFMKRGLFISLILVIMLLLAGLVSMLYSANTVGESVPQGEVVHQTNAVMTTENDTQVYSIPRTQTREEFLANELGNLLLRATLVIWLGSIIIVFIFMVAIVVCTILAIRMVRKNRKNKP